uniref:Uncharacterized protein n=1 Tax=Anguilla anguilla TaxID=7936 RepID=A0A0E9U321_ANGAN
MWTKLFQLHLFHKCNIIYSNEWILDWAYNTIF